MAAGSVAGAEGVAATAAAVAFPRCQTVASDRQATTTTTMREAAATSS